MKIKQLLLAIFILTLGGLIAYRINSNSAQEEKGKDKGGVKPPTKVEVQVLSPQTYNDHLLLTGSASANEQTNISSEINGIIEKIYFQEGMTVEAGQPLAKIKDAELQAQLQQAKTKENLAFENERRAKLLVENEGISKEEYEVNRAEYLSSRALTQLIQAQVDKTLIKAPFSGKIGLRNVSVGSYISPNIPITQLINLDKIKINFTVPEKYAHKIKKGTLITCKTAASDKQYQATIYAFEPEIAVNTRSLAVRAIADNNSGALIPGSFVSIQLPLDKTDNALIIPSESVVPIQGGKKVFIVQNGTAHEVKIETAARTEDKLVVLSGLKKGDTLITSGVMALKDKAPVSYVLPDVKP